MHVAALRLELHLRSVHSLKEKRATIRPVLEGCRHRFSVAAAEVGHQDRWQLATIGVAVVSGSATHTVEVLDAVERFIWSFPELEVTSCQRQWLEDDQ
ncbi:MAG: DUF503 domain-containing protein [Acidimicrobiales bacterium]